MKIDWKDLLARWSKELVASPLSENLPIDVIASGWLGFPGASEAELANLENRLGQQLPPSYREFLQVSNGWRLTTSFISNLWPTGKVEWVKKRHPDVIEAWTQFGGEISVSDNDYFVYGEEQDPASLRSEYLNRALSVSELTDNGMYLLNPQVINAAGEWEAWFFASWLPGAQRYQSFGDLMVAELEAFLADQNPRLKGGLVSGNAADE